MENIIDTLADILEDEDFQMAMVFIAAGLIEQDSDVESVSEVRDLFERLLVVVKTTAAAFDEALKNSRKAFGQDFLSGVETFRKEGAGRPKKEKNEVSFADLMAGKKK